MIDQELLAYEREHHDDPDMTLEKATETQRLALHCWASGAATRRRTGLPSRRRDVAYIRRCFRATPLSLSQKGGRDWKSATTTAGSPDPLTKLAATLDPTAGEYPQGEWVGEAPGGACGAGSCCAGADWDQAAGSRVTR